MKIACAAFALLLAAFPVLAQNVKITPIGSHPGELCASDRAIIFEDPTGVRFLYDAAQNVTGGNDPRLGTIHLVLLSHMHGDHVAWIFARSSPRWRTGCNLVAKIQNQN